MLSNDERISWSILTGHKNIKLVKLFFTFTKEPPLITIRSKEKKPPIPRQPLMASLGQRLLYPTISSTKLRKSPRPPKETCKKNPHKRPLNLSLNLSKWKVETSKPNEIMQFNQKFQAADLFVYTDCANFA